MTTLPAPFRGALRSAIGRQWGFLRRFGADVTDRLSRAARLASEAVRAIEAQGEDAARGFDQPTLGAWVTARARQYARAAWGQAQNVVREVAVVTGAGWERRVMGSPRTEHCGVCPEQAARGWQPAGTLLPIGATPCGSRCLCHYEFSRGPVPPS